MTLYRVGKNSPIVKALIEAAENGIRVTALVELKARFDEENNLHWARALERAGAHVVYGIAGLKVRKDGNRRPKSKRRIKTYPPLNRKLQRSIGYEIYTDVGFFHADRGVAKNATKFSTI